MKRLSVALLLVLFAFSAVADHDRADAVAARNPSARMTIPSTPSRFGEVRSNFCDASECGSLPASGDWSNTYGDKGASACTRAVCYECSYLLSLGITMCTETYKKAYCYCVDGSNCTNSGACSVN